MFKIAIAGSLPSNARIRRKADELLGLVRGELAVRWELRQKEEEQTNNEENSVELHESEAIWLLVSPLYTSNSWNDWVNSSDCLVKNVTMPDKAGWEAHQTLCLHTKHRGIIGESLCADANLLLVVWDESPNASRGSTLELMRIAQRRELPCIWISANSGDMFWPEETLYMKYSTSKLQQLCQQASVPIIHPVEPEKDRRMHLMRIGIRLQTIYLKKYKAAPPDSMPPEDSLLRDDYYLQDKFQEREPIRKKILKHYNAFDQMAIELSSKYRGVTYWQAILPFIITCFLALGFYSTDILGITPIPRAILQGLGAIGFLINACLNMHMFDLGRNTTIKHWQTSFLSYRGIAELLRVLIHFIPFGIILDLRNLCADDYSIYHTVREICFDECPGVIDVDQQSAEEILRHLKEMIGDQIAYHEASEKRYSGIVKSLSRWAQVISISGTVFVILRALLQFWQIFKPFPNSLLGNIPLNAFIGNTANMVAMMVTAWAAYFSTKLSQCNYQYNLENHQRMKNSLQQIDEQLKTLERKFTKVPLEYVTSVGESLARTMLFEDTAMWIRWYRKGK